MENFFSVTVLCKLVLETRRIWSLVRRGELKILLHIFYDGFL